MSELRSANLEGANLSETDLRRADLRWANLEKADLRNANLRDADLRSVTMIETKLAGADLTGCRVYGMSAWGLDLSEVKQRNLVITPDDETRITVDTLDVAQFVYLLTHNKKVRDVIDTITSKVALILGRFTPKRKEVLDTIREELRQRGWAPVLFDFEKPASKDLTGTVQTLANMARFIIADLTDPSCVPHELAIIMPTTVVPLQPILLDGQREYAMFLDLNGRYEWVLEPYRYASRKRLIAELGRRVIEPAEAKARELQRGR